MAPMSTRPAVTTTTTIAAPPERVWAVLTEPGLVRGWLSDDGLRIDTTWRIGEPVVIAGPWHGRDYRAGGTLLAFDPPRELRYTNWSPLSGEPDEPLYHTEMAFRLAPKGAGTELEVSHANLAGEPARAHSAFYWNVAMARIRAVSQESAR